MKRYLLVVVLGVVMAACGGKQTDASSSADVETDLSPIDELKSLPDGLTAQMDLIMKPISDVEVLVNDITALPAKLSIDASALSGMCNVAFEGGEITIDAELTVDVEAKAEVEALLVRIKEVSADLKATPEKVQELTTMAGETMLKVPTLATKVTTKAQATLSNPLAKAEKKLEAQAEIDAVANIKTDVSASIEDVQSKITELPALATEAIGKLTASFAAGASS